MALPAEVEYGTVKWKALSAVADGVDVDGLPDAVPVAGTVQFTPSVSVLLATGTVPVTILATPVTYTLDADGVLRDAEGRDEITLLATDSEGVTPTGWTWKATYRLDGGLARGAFSFSLPAGETVDLTTVAPVSSSNGVPIIQGPAGPAGSVYPLVIHGDEANYARPDVDTPVIWFGTVDPANSDDELDVWVRVESTT